MLKLPLGFALWLFAIDLAYRPQWSAGATRIHRNVRQGGFTEASANGDLEHEHLHSIHMEGTKSSSLQLAIYQRTIPRKKRKRGGETGAIGLGDAFDVTYNVMIKVGDVQTPVVLDTGSSDLWVLSSACSTCQTILTNLNSNSPSLSSGSAMNSSSDLPAESISAATSQVRLYPEENLISTGLDVELQYGDSYTGTHAYGVVGQDTVSIAGLQLQGQYFAAINNTNTSVLQTGSAGIFGLGFPYNSILWNDLNSKLSAPLNLAEVDLEKIPRVPSRRQRRLLKGGVRYSRTGPLSDHSAFSLPSFLSSNTQTTGVSDFFSSISNFGPFLTRLAIQNQVTTQSLLSPQFTITLERTTLDPGGNVGQLTLGSLPASIVAANTSSSDDNANAASESNLTWTNVRLYNTTSITSQSALDGQNSGYPLAWEVYLDDVWLDGVKLQRSTLGGAFATNARLSTLIDTGNSLIRGPADVISAIYAAISQSSNSSTDFLNASSPVTYPCADSHVLSFQFHGVLFNVDPRDFGSQAYADDVETCVPNLAVTDTPMAGGYLYSWSLGIPFMKGVLTSFYYGDLINPSNDPPRIGFLSTVPTNAPALLQEAIAEALTDGDNIPALVEPAPTGTITPAWTDSYGVGQEPETLGFFTTSSASTASSSTGLTTSGANTRTTVPLFYAGSLSDPALWACLCLFLSCCFNLLGIC